jgi:hypothetical protein
MPYDGREDGIFNFSGYVLFTHECMFAYWDNMRVSPLSYYAYWQQLQLAHVRAGTASLLPHRGVVR